MVTARGSLVHPEAGAPCGARQATFFRVAEVIMGALAQAIPDRIPAAGCGQGSILFLAVPEFTTGRSRVSIVQPLVGGSGGRPTMDGTDGVDFNTGFYRNIPSEVLECDMPVVVERYALRAESGGAGKYRGGMGLDYALTVLPPEAVLTSRGMERYAFQPWGREGGRPGANGRTVLVTADGARTPLGKIDVIRMPPRATLIVRTAGGGGYGDSFERDPRLVLADVLDGLVSAEQARTDGGIDAGETEQLRATAFRASHRFDFGGYRVSYEAAWPHPLQTAVNQLTAKLAPAPRQYVRGRLIAAVEARRACGARVDEAALGEIYERVVGELQVGLLESL
jgi:N-methylhydantoinase B